MLSASQKVLQMTGPESLEGMQSGTEIGILPVRGFIGNFVLQVCSKSDFITIKKAKGKNCVGGQTLERELAERTR